MQNDILPPGFITVDRAVEIIKANTRENPDVDLDYAVRSLPWLETKQNFRLQRIRRLKPEEIRRSRYGIPIEYEKVGEYNIEIKTDFDRELMKKTILDKFRELTGHEYRQLSVRARSTVADDAQGKAAVQPRNNPKPIAKEGTVIGEGTTMNTNGDGISV